MDALDDTERRVGTLQLLAQQGEADVVHPAAAVRLGDRRPQEALLAHLREELAVDLAGRVPLTDIRQDLRLGEGSRGIAHELVLIGQAEVDHRRNRTRQRVTRGSHYAGTKSLPRLVSTVAIERLAALR